MNKNFNTSLCTIMRKPDTVVPGSEWERLNGLYEFHRVFPYGEDGVLVSLFPNSVTNPVDAIYPVIVEEEVREGDAAEVKNNFEDIILQTVEHLSGETQSVLMSPGQASQIFKALIAPTLPVEGEL